MDIDRAGRPTPILDELIANAWPAQIDVEHEGWRFRWNSGVSRRANSVLAIGSNELVPELVAEAEAFYRRRGCPPRFQVSTASAPDRLAEYLASRGYIPEAQTLVERAATDEVIKRTGAGSWEICATDRPTDEWFHSRSWRTMTARGGCTKGPVLLSITSTATSRPDSQGRLMVNGG